MAQAPPGPLAGRRVLDLADEKGAYCGKLLADLGAEVIKIEPPGGCRTRGFPPFLDDEPGPDCGFFFLYMNTSKRGLVLSLETEAGRETFLRLAARADLVIETFAPGWLAGVGLGYPRLRAINPWLVLTSITGFGQNGPQRHWRGSDLVAGALGGALYVTGEPEDPPVALAGMQSCIMASAFAAAGSLVALFHASTTGAGQHVDISMQETTAAAAHVCGVGKWLEDGLIPKRFGSALFASVPSGAYRCADGLVYLMVNRPGHWKALAEWIHQSSGIAEVLDPMFEGPSSNRQPYRELLDLYIGELTSRLTVEEVYREGQRRHIAFTPVNSLTAVAASRQLAARNFFMEVPLPGHELRVPGAPYGLSATPWRIHRPPPRLGQHEREVLGELEPGAAGLERAPVAPRTEPATQQVAEGSPGALNGLRVLEFSAGMAGPWIGRMMAWAGAEVIKVESEAHPDVTRLYVAPNAPEAGPQPDLSPWFTDWNAGKRFVGLDLTRPAAVELCKRIVARCDVVVENYSAGVLDKLGLGYASLARFRPDLVMLSSNGLGDSGPDRAHVTWGPNIEAISGLSSVSGFSGRPCTITQYAYPDPLSAVHGLVAVMAALAHRRRTGQGQSINLSQLEATICGFGPVMMEHLASGREPAKLGNGALHACPQGCYRCQGEDRWCAITVEDDAAWQALCRVMGRGDLAADASFSSLAGRSGHVEQIDAAIAAWCASQDAYRVMDLLQEAGVAAGVVQTAEDLLLRDRQLRARRFFETIPHLRKGTVTTTGIPLGLTGTPGRTTGSGQKVGHDNRYVFGEIIGLSTEQIDAYLASGVIEQA